MEEKIILFDLDGTLIDSTEAILESFGVAFRSFDMDVPKDWQIKEQIGHPLDSMFASLGVESEKVALYVDRYKQHYQKISKAKTKLLPFAKEAIVLAKEYARLGVVTTKTALYSKVLLDHLDVMDYFEILIGREDVVYPKPHPEPIYKALEFFGDINKGNVFMIGDTCMDIEAAKSAGICGVGVSSGYATVANLKKCGTIVYSNAYEAVKNIVKK